MGVNPIIFSGPMVMALLAGAKTQTRRPLKPQPKVLNNGIWYRPYPALRPLHWAYMHGDKVSGYAESHFAPGDLLYMREAWRTSSAVDHLNPSRIPPHGAGLWYESDRNVHPIMGGRLRPSIHMPRWASRITLEVTDVRVQRLQDISEEDARAEGVRGNAGGEWGCEGLIEDFSDLWDSLHGEGAWDRNDWVAAYSFTVHRCNVDDLLRQREAA